MSLKIDGSEDNLIHCFKDGQLCSAGLTLLKEQLNLLMDLYILNSNLFEPSDFYKEKVNTEENLFGQDNEEDQFLTEDTFFS